MRVRTTLDPPRERATDGAQALRCWLANLGALYRGAPELAAALDALPFAALPPIERTRDGHACVRIRADDGTELYAHSRYQPRAEAARFVDALPAVENPTFVVCGAGLGYHLLELERRYDKPLIVVVESDLALLKAGCCVCDFTPLLREGRLLFLTAPDKRLIHERLNGVNANLMLGMQLVVLPYTARVGATFQQQMRRLITEFLTFCRLQMVSLLRNARATCKNIAFNLPDYLRYPGVETLQGRAAGYPAIVVAAGPSLARQLDTVLALHDRAVIIAVQTVFKLMLARGRPPHFVTSLDYHEVSAQFFRDAGDVGACVLVAEPKATWHVLDAYHGRKHVLHSSFADELLRDAAPRRGALPAGSTVAHLSFFLAEHLGCDPIILVGQDLCFSDGLYYPPGMPIEQTWAPELGRFQTIEMKQWERIVRNRPILRTVADVHGRAAYTDDQLFTYAEQFQAHFAQSRAKVIHAGEAGMRLAGTTVMSLADAAARYCTRPLPPGLFAAADAGGAAPAVMTRARAALAERVREVATMRGIAEQVRDLLAQLLKRVDVPREFNRLLVRVDALRVGMQQHEDAYALVVQVAQLGELRRLNADRRLGEQAVETAETARQRVQRDHEFVSAFIDGCRYLETMLPQARERIGEEA